MALFGDNKWTEEKIMAEAVKYRTVAYFQERSPLAFIEAKKQGLMLDIEQYYAEPLQLTDEATYEEIREVAKSFTNKIDFLRFERVAYDIASKKGWLNWISDQLWQGSKVKYQAIDGRIKYGSYVDWHDANPQLDQDIKAKGHGRKFIQTFYSEFNAINVFYHSLQFYSRKEWKEKAPNHYAYASSNGLAALINRRRIYFQRFVGFIRPTILKASNQLPFCVTSATYLTRSAAATYGVWDLYPKRHQKKKFTYKRESRWSVERLKEVASNYDSASDFLHFELSAYHAASKQGLLRELTKEMNTKVHRPYNEDSVRELLKRYSNLVEIRSQASGLHNWLINHSDQLFIDNLLNEAGIKRSTKKNTLTKFYCANVAKKYSKLNDFRLAENSVYIKASKYNWLEDITNHMERQRFPRGYWTELRCWDCFVEYEGNIEAIKNDFSGCVTAIRRNGLLNIFQARYAKL